MKMVSYKIVELIGEHCITFDDGQKLYDVIYPQLKSGQHVELDFDGVEIFVSRFFNAAIGQLLKDIEASELNQLLKFSHLPVIGRNIIQKVIENAKKYYSDENYQKAVDVVLHEQEGAL